MPRSRTLTTLSAAAIVFLLGPAEAAATQMLANHVPAAVTESRRLGPVSGMARLNLTVGLPLRNSSELDSFVAQVADPASPNYRQYLSASEFVERFGPTQEDYDKLAAFFQANGFTISGIHPNRMILDVTGTVAAVNQTLHVNMTAWEHPARGQFFAPDRDPSLDVEVVVLDITGLDNFTVPRPMNLKAVPLTSAAPLVTGSGPDGLFIGKDLRAAYAPSVTLTGTGQTVGLFELDGFFASDVQANFQAAGLPPSNVQTVLLDGFNGVPGGGNIEVTLDIMMAAYMAPGANIIVYEGTNWNDVLNRMATDNIAKQLSSSWCYSPINSTTEQIFKQMIAQGQSMMQASGDSGAYSGWIMPPADDPNVTVVGGTALTTNGPGGPWQSETTWSGSGGGVSTTYAIPSYQQGMNMTAIGGSNTMRNIPDVAMLADPELFLIADDGAGLEIGGTSAAAPLWAGFLALANQQAAANGDPPVGFLNPTIYALGASSLYAAAMHDITTGSNGYSAGPGYDLATGWGTPAGQALINDLSPAGAFTLAASPSAVSIAPGGTAKSTITVTLKSGFSGQVTMSASGLPKGVTASFSPSTTTTTSTLTLTASSSAAAGTANITVTGTSGTATNAVSLALTVTAGPDFSAGISPASFSLVEGASASGTVTITPANGFTGLPSLTITGLPSGVTAAFSPASTNSTSKLTLTAAATATVGSATATLTATSGSITQKITVPVAVTAPPSFKLSASTNVSVGPGGKATAAISVVPQNGFTGTVSFAASGLPAGVTASFAAASSGATLTLTAASTAKAQTSPFTVTGASGNLSASLSMTVTVTPPPDFSVTIAPASLSIVEGGKGAAAVSITPLNGFAGTVTLSGSGLPSGVTASFNAPVDAEPALAIFSVSSSAAAGTGKVTVTATSGTLSHTATLNLTVLAPTAGAAAVDLSPAYNVSGIAIDNVPFTSGGLDAGGRSYSGILLGASQNVGGTVFALGPMGVPDAVSGQTVTLPSGQFTTLKFLATGVNGNQPGQKFAITYTDGTVASFSQSLSDWYTPQNYPGESVAVTNSYRDNSTGTTDGRPFNLYGYSLILNSSKTVKSITLPQNRNVVVMAMTLTGSVNMAAAAEVNLASVFNGVGITVDGTPFSGGLDGLGNAYSGSLLAGTPDFNNVQFQLGAAGSPNVVSGKSSAVTLPAGKYSTLAVLATGVNGAQLAQQFKVTYTDGTSVTFTQNLSDWFTPANYPGEVIALSMPYRNTASGAKDDRTFQLYEYTFALNNAKTVSSISLAANSNVKVLAISLKP